MSVHDARWIVASALIAVLSSVGASAQPMATSPLAPVCPDGRTPVLTVAEYPVVIRAGTYWNRHEYTSEERKRILYHADAIRQHFTPPASLGDIPILAEFVVEAWGGAPSAHSAVGAKLVLVMKPDGHVRTTFWQVVPFSKRFAVALTDAIVASDKAGDFEGIPRAGAARGDDTLVVQLRTMLEQPSPEELPVMRVRLQRYVTEEPPRVQKQGQLYYPMDPGDAGIENRGEIQVLVGSDGRPVMSGTQVTRIEWRNFLSTMRRAVETTEYAPARSGGCAVPSLFLNSFDFSVQR